jgi:peptide chain release factor 1
MLEKLAGIECRYLELDALLADPEIVIDHEKVTELAREQASLQDIVQGYRRYLEIGAEIEGTRELLEDESDQEMLELAQAEAAILQEEQARLEQTLRHMLIPTNPNDQKNVIVEVRAGTGGDEAGLFAADLHRMYQRYAELRRWKTDVISSHSTGIGGYKQVVFQIRGKGAYSRLKYESGVHRVQRVPDTETQGRIHTSTATVAVLPEMDEVEISIDPSELDIEVYTSSGPGGQHMQKNSTAVRITHKPSGLVVSCENQRSQTQNRLQALAVLRARLYEIESDQQQADQAQQRRSQVGTGERSEKIRTYNFPQGRVTDHRIGLTSYRLGGILNGALDEFIDELLATEQAMKLQALGQE